MKLRTVIGNSAWMALVQAANTALPLLTVPLVSRAFGPTLYGQVASLTAIAGYAALLIVFGFHLSGPRAVVRLERDPAELSRTVSGIYAAQLLLAALATAASLALLPLLGYRGEQWTLGAIILLGVVASALTPVWMFIGLQRMRQVALSQVATRLVGAAAILLLVRGPGDVYLFVAANAATSLLCLGLCLAQLWRLGHRLRPVGLRAPLEAIGAGSRLFVSAVAINLYTASNVVVVSLLAGPMAAGYFALADRIRGAATGVLDPVSQALYPYLCGTGADEATAALRIRNRRLFFQAMVALSFCASLGLYLVAPILAGVLGGDRFAGAVPILRALSPAPVLICLNNLLGLQVMLPLDMEAALSRVVMGAAAIGLPLMVGATWWAGAIGTAWAYTAVELGITVAQGWLVSRREPLLPIFLSTDRLAAWAPRGRGSAKNATFP